MSEPLKDLRTKVNSMTWALLEAESRATGRDQAEIAREILHAWAAERFRIYKVAQDLLRSTGHDGA